MSDSGETIRFGRDELGFSYLEDVRNGKVYRAGSAFGVPRGMIEVRDMRTGDIDMVLANASGTRPADDGPVGCSLLGGAGVAPMSLLAMTARDGERMWRDKLRWLRRVAGEDPALATMQVTADHRGIATTLAGLIGWTDYEDLSWADA